MVERSVKQENDFRRKVGWTCVDCDRVTGAVNEEGEPQCPACQKGLRAATARAVAVCECGEPMLAEARCCGFCEAELSVKAGS